MGKSSTSWKPGQSGNPGGRPKDGESMSSLMREILEEEVDTPAGKITRRKLFLRRIYQLAVYKGRENLLRLIWNYDEGTPVQKLEHSGPDGENLSIEVIFGKSGSTETEEDDTDSSSV